MTFGSLFAGIGGFDLGFERAGMRCVWQVEIDPYCRRVLAKHWPDVPRWDDVKTFTGDGFERPDVICGGFPCQPFSSASRGRRRGAADDRYLWPEMRRIVDAIRPAWVVVENVAHLDGTVLEEVVFDLEASGYEVGTLEVPACAFGHDHRRTRLWILGHTDRDGKPGLSVDAEMAGVPWVDRQPGGVGTEDGISTRLDRLRGLGNAVVPQVAEWIGRWIVEAEGSR